MTALKEKVMQMIKALPDNVTIDDIISELYFKIQVDAGLKELDEGKSIPHEMVRERFAKWTTK
jgi:predicted transcriptional regulator